MYTIRTQKMIPVNSIFTNINIFTCYTLKIIPPRPARICFLYIFCIYCFSSQSSGTTIVLCGNKDTIVVAADSKGVFGVAKEFTFTTCKIHKINDSLFMAIAGIIGSAQAGITVPDTLRYLLDVSSGDIVSKIDFAAKGISKYLIDFMSTIPDVDTKEALLSVTFFGRENGVLKYYLRRFTMEQDSIGNSPQIQVESYGVSLFEQRISYIVTAKDVEFIPSYMASHPNNISVLPMVRSMMDVALQNNTTNSHAPVDIILVTKTGYNWIQRKQECDQ
jgi:hypothetical protein